MVYHTEYHNQTNVNKINYKMIYYYLYLTIGYDFIMYELSNTTLKKIDNLINQYIKKYIGIPKSSTPELIHYSLLFQFPSMIDIYI